MERLYYVNLLPLTNKPSGYDFLKNFMAISNWVDAEEWLVCAF